MDEDSCSRFIPSSYESITAIAEDRGYSVYVAQKDRL